MKKVVLIITTLFFLSGGVHSQGFESGMVKSTSGFTGPIQGITTVKQVLDSGMFSDDMPVTLVGKIKSSLGGDMYLFGDDSGDVTVEIDHDKWFGQTVTPDTKVKLIGEIDKSIVGIKVDVDVVHVIL